MANYDGLKGFMGRGGSFFALDDKKDAGVQRKLRIINHIILEQLQRTLQMFEWKITSNGKDSTKITKRSLELLVQTSGLGGVIKHNDELYCVYGTLGGEPNWNYMPSKFIFANAFLNISRECDIYGINSPKDVVIIPNDSLYRGMLPMLKFHAEQITETYLTKRSVLIWMRAARLLTAPTSDSMKDILDYIRDIEEGKLAAIYDKNYLKDVSELSGDSTPRGLVTQILECLQYEKAAMYNDCGLQMNYNMKRESITSSEAQLGEGALLPKPDDMMDMRKIAVKQIKEVFDEQWEVEFSSAWRDLHQSINLEIELEKKEVQTSGQGESSNGGDNDSDSTSGTEHDGDSDSGTEPHDESVEPDTDSEETVDDGNS